MHYETSPEKLLEIVYDDLRRLAGSYMQNERSDHTLQATALVHEAYMRLVDWKNVSWQNRAQFFSVAAEVMRKVLIDHARARQMCAISILQQRLRRPDFARACAAGRIARPGR